MKSGNPIRVESLATLQGRVSGNPLVQIALAERPGTLGEAVSDSGGQVVGYRCDVHPDAVVLMDGARKLRGATHLLSLSSSSTIGSLPAALWLVPKPLKPDGDPDLLRRREDAIVSWVGHVTLREEVRSPDGAVVEEGLRSPQIGAIFGLLAHWKASEALATVVMPTGTGKTETMLALLVRERFSRLLVLVPTDALRSQLARKFESLGRLRTMGVVPDDVANPVVGCFKHGFTTAEEARAFIEPCNVVVATAAILAAADKAVKSVFAEMFSALFIDEAHHTGASTWAEIRALFEGKPGGRVVQFTATPFREDGRMVDGKVVFRFPMKKALEEGYFRRIRYVPVDTLDEDDADDDIARRALRALDDDLAAGLDHVLMARTKSIPRAVQVLDIYKRIAPAHSPVLVHSRMSAALLEAAHAALRGRRTRVIVCVDMLGEGFDFPNLKVAALHDPHSSLAVTLQFLGRFTRDAPRLGEATAVASLATRSMDARIQTLYAEDADWATILSTLSEDESSVAEERSEFLLGFGPDEEQLVSLRQIQPKMSAAVYETAATSWNPLAIEDGVGNGRVVAVPPRVNPIKRTVFAITREDLPVRWGSPKHIQDSVWHLFLAHWDEARGLLFINTSDNAMSLDRMAEALMGAPPAPIRGDAVFKGFYGIKRMVLMNVGLKHERNSRFTRFSMLVGPDVAQGITRQSLGNKTRTNIFAMGLENGRRVTIGASAKGRLWSHAVAHDLSRWVAWCAEIGSRIRNPAANPDTVLAGALVPEEVDARPAAVPLFIDWGWKVMARPEEAVIITIGGSEVPLLETSLEIVNHSAQGRIAFRLITDFGTRDFEMDFLGKTKGVRYVQTGGSPVHIRAGRREMLLTDWLSGDDPMVIFADGSQLQGHVLCKPQAAPALAPLDDQQILAWNWPPEVDIQKESIRRYTGQAFTTVQGHVCHVIGGSDWEASAGFSYDIIFDDDDAGEAADVVAMGTQDGKFRIDLFHCKFSGEDKAGARVEDLYAVCGQAARSVRWIGNPPKLLDHLVQRRRKRLRDRGQDRLIRGTEQLLKRFARSVPDSKVQFRVFAVQPGLSKARVGAGQNVVDVLAAVDAYLHDAVELDFNIVCSP